MHSARFVGLSIVLAAAMVPASVSAQGGPSAGGSCGYRAGDYGLNSLSPLDIRNPNRGGVNVGTIHAQVVYSGVQPGTVLTIITAPGSSNKGIDLTTAPAVRTTTAQGTSGSVAFSMNQNESGASRFGKKGTATNKGHGKQGATSSAGQSNAAGLYFFQTWADGKLIGTFSCSVDDRE
jgi:hypothetical protein